MYDINKRTQFSTAKDLKKLLETVSDDTKIVICGDDNAWFHIETDGSVVCLDYEDLDVDYDEKLFRKENR